MVKLRLASILKERKISKRGFAKTLGIDYANVFRYFREDYDPKLSTLAQWSKVLALPISDLFDQPPIKSTRRKK